ncbi:MAG: hypothetical protein Q4C46_10225 [Bacillota bacterium]|nr:hypothetical protein [Bacillota bacterium]
MASNKIGKAIKQGCKGDKKMEGFLLDLLDFHMSGKSWWKEDYKKLMKKYVEEEDDEN